MMQILPSIDILNGKVVSLRQGRLGSEVVYSENPLDVARYWEKLGADGLHIVDLNRALGFGIGNQRIVERILSSLSISSQVGGGIRTLSEVSHFIRKGAEKVVLGTAILEYPTLVAELQQKYDSEKIVVALDYQSKRLLSRGWQRTVSKNPLRVFETLLHKGFSTFLFTSKSRDGTLAGPDLSTLKLATRRNGAEVIASGGIRDTRDIVALMQIGVKGAVIGLSLYQGSLRMSDALRMSRD